MEISLKTLHIDADTVPFVGLEGGIAYRLLQARPEDRLLVTQVRAQPGAESRLHRHVEPVYGFTTVGAWGHDRTYAYHPGSYIYETPGVLHRFLNGPGVSEAIFVSHGNVEYMAPDGSEVADIVTPELSLQAYLAQCEAEGHAPPDILR